jgi:hypothetical protein
MLTILYVCNHRKKRSSEQKICEKILVEFANYSGLDFAYPTQRFYNNLTEGKQNQEEQ